MSTDDIEYEDVDSYSAFWPVLILTVGIFIWVGYQTYEIHKQKAALDAEFQASVTTVQEAQAATTRLYALAQDLIQTSAKDQYAAQIVKEANIQIHSNDSGASGAAPDTNDPTKL